jgi:hypothetical protein
MNQQSKPDRPDVEPEIRRYRLERHKRARTQLQNDPRYCATGESSDMIRFARMWAPFGGAPDDEIMVRFGMTKPRFLDVLMQVLTASGGDPEIAPPLTRLYGTR